MSWVIYKHTCLKNNLIYIGIAKGDPKKRWKNGEGYKTQFPFYYYIKKYGWNKGFTHEVLIENIETKREALDLEKELIKQYYNNEAYRESIKNKYNYFGSIYLNSTFPEEHYKKD